MFDIITLVTAVLIEFIAVFLIYPIGLTDEILNTYNILLYVHLLVLCRIPRMLWGLTLFKPYRDIF